MALAYYDRATPYEASYEASPLVAQEMTEHVRTYRKFVFFMRLAAFAVPFFVAFVLYWTT
jgi:hypothetical protein